MTRSIEQFITGADFNDPTEIHHGDAVRDMTQNAQIMRDKYVTGRARSAQVVNKIDDLCLNRDIKRGRRLVQDHNIWVERQGSGDPNPLFLPA